MRFDGVFDCADEYGVLNDGDDDATGCEIYDDFFGGDVLDLLGGGRKRAKRQGACKNHERRDSRARNRGRETSYFAQRPGSQNPPNLPTLSQNYRGRKRVTAPARGLMGVAKVAILVKSES